MSFPIRNQLDGKVTVVQLPQRLNPELSEELKSTLYKLVDEKHFNLVIDLEKTDYIESSGLAALVSRIAVCRSHKGDIRLASPTKFVCSLLEITHLNQVLKSYDGVQSAVHSFT